MNSDADNVTKADAESPVTEISAEAGSDAVAKPVRRKRAVKAVVANGTDAVTADSADTAPADAIAEAVASKPVRKRRSTKSAEAAIVEAPADMSMAEAAGLPVQQAVAQSSDDEPIVASQSAVGGDVDQPASADRNTATDTMDDAPVAADATAQATPGEATPGEGGPRSERSRRRGRRDRRRGRGDDAASSEGAAASGEGTDDEDDAPRGEPVPTLPPADVGEVFAQVVSGEFDVEEEAQAPAEEAGAAVHKRVLRPEPDAPKLHKVLAQAGVGSRRDMEQLIADGKVAVNGQPAHVGQRISFGDRIQVDGKPVKVRIVPPPPRVIAYHKPVGEVVTNDDPQHRPTVFRRLPRLPQGKWQSVGRLDLNTEGLLLFTNSGELANQLMHPRFGVEREYAVRVLGTLDNDAREDLLEGVEVEGQTASFRSIDDGGGEGANHWYRVVITEGRNREVRKLFEAVDLTVSRLIRIRYGTVVLPRGLKRGVWVDLSDEDVRTIRRLAGGGEGQARDDRGGRGARNKPRNERRNDRGDRNDRGPRNGPRGNRPPETGARTDAPRERDERDADIDDDFDPARIPNPLEQTFDKRFVQNPRSSVGGRGFRSGGGGFGAGGSGPGPKKSGGPKEPDPLQTSVGYIGADAFHRKGGRGGGGGRGGNRGGGGFGGGGGGGFGGGRRGR
jgi:23S rRNA pseudouridine2605 synthase